LIEQAGLRKRFGDAGIHKNQALVLVNYGNATGQEILNVSKNIQKRFIKHLASTLKQK
jgi:UDP-N-acetylmuramate dehydrogenase